MLLHEQNEGVNTLTVSQEISADLVIIGGSLGGCAAALAALQTGKTVILTEETKWIGGQITNQGVPPDEHPWIESFGATRNYRTFRRKIRDYYFNNYPVKNNQRNNQQFNPGNALVSNISHEPRVALRVLYDLLAPYLSSGKLTLLTEYKIISAETEKDQVLALTVNNPDDRTFASFKRKVFFGCNRNRRCIASCEC